jgi:Tfp pilus assembly protein PilE
MYCTKCGKEIPDVEGALYCPQCGIAQMTGGNRLGTPAKKTSVGLILLIVLVVGSIPVIGILAAIAIPQYHVYQVKGSNSIAASEIRKAKASCETYFNNNQLYPENLELAGFKPAQQEVSISYESAPDRKSYLMTCRHKKGDRVFAANSEKTEVLFRLKSEADDTYRPL